MGTRKKPTKSKGTTKKAPPGRKGTPTRTRAKPKPVKAPPAPSAARTAADELLDASKSELALLAVLSDPQTFTAKADENIAKAGISRRHYFRLKADPEFQRKLRIAQLDAIKSGIAPSLSALMTTAGTVGREGNADRKLLFEMAGYYVPFNKFQVEETSNRPTVAGDLPDDELVFMYLACSVPREQWIPGVLQRYELGQIMPRQPHKPNRAEPEL